MSMRNSHLSGVGSLSEVANELASKSIDSELTGETIRELVRCVNELNALPGGGQIALALACAVVNSNYDDSWVVCSVNPSGCVKVDVHTSEMTRSMFRNLL